MSDLRRPRATRLATVTLLDRYIEATAVRTLVLVSAGLTSLFSLLELINQLHDVGKGQYRLIDAMTYVLLTAPARLLQLMPASILLTALFALGGLASHNELTVMRAAGVSPRRIVGSVFKVAGLVLVVLFLAAQFVIPFAEQRAQTERVSRLSSASEPLRSENSLWAEGEHRYLNVRRFAHGNNPEDIYIYEFAASGKLQRFIYAAGAEVRADGTWLLRGVLRKQFSDTGSETERVASLSWHSFLRPSQVSLLILPPESMQPVELYQYVRDLEGRHLPAAPYVQELWTKIDIPLAMVAMIMIAVPFVLGPLRTHVAGRIMIGAMIGIVFSLVQQITLYLGSLLDLSPALTATLPSLTLMAVAFYLLRRAHLL